jgi:hypothetical protein
MENRHGNAPRRTTPARTERLQFHRPDPVIRESKFYKSRLTLPDDLASEQICGRAQLRIPKSLEAVEQGMAVWNVGTLPGVPRCLCTVALGSRFSLIGHITLDVKCAGARSAGNPHATCDDAGLETGSRFG